MQIYFIFLFIKKILLYFIINIDYIRTRVKHSCILTNDYILLISLLLLELISLHWSVLRYTASLVLGLGVQETILAVGGPPVSEIVPLIAVHLQVLGSKFQLSLN